jgi:uncharacterized protein with HEPN domain
MTKQELIQHFLENHNQLIDFTDTLTEDKFTYSNNEKWTAGQQLEHIVLCLKPLEQALSSKAFIIAKFGKIERPTLNYDTVINNYRTALTNGGKAPERYIPEQVEASNRLLLSSQLKELLQSIQQRITSYTEEELDTLILPHPLLGNLTIREMFYLMAYHATHHHLQTTANLKDYPNDHH